MVEFKHPSLKRPPADLIGGEWISLASPPKNSKAAAAPVASLNPAQPGRTVWAGNPRLDHVSAAIDAARKAFPAWSAWGRDRRFGFLRRFAELSKARAGAMADLICDETGKVMWEAKGEASALASKVEITLDASPIGGLRRVEGYDFEMGAQKTGRCWYKPHGVMGVLGPFNFPAHLPNGHIIPALAMGNTIVFKPSDKAPAVGQMLVELLEEALDKEAAPNRGKGVINLVQGGADVAAALSAHEGLDGILFTGSWPVGRRISEANLDRPGRILALEMGGNNAAIVMDDADIRQSVIEVIRCAFNTTGQRCTCTRRLIVHVNIADRLLPPLVKAAESLVIGDPRSPKPVFTGPIISEAARKTVLDFQAKATKGSGGAEVLLKAAAIEHPGGGWYLSPSILQVDKFSPTDTADAGSDTEIFGPLLRVCVVRDLDQAIEQSNATRFGLAASIFTHNQAAAERFMVECRAGCINVNTGTAGASSKLPFGGVGLSGNHRPAGSFSMDYCTMPIAGMIERGAAAQLADGMKFEDRWV